MKKVLLLLLFLVMVVLGILHHEYTTTAFWFELLVGVALLPFDFDPIRPAKPVV